MNRQMNRQEFKRTVQTDADVMPGTARITTHGGRQVTVSYCNAGSWLLGERSFPNMREARDFCADRKLTIAD
jgi:hypothetical protein